ncbi:MAG: trypsin-like peptidase domain-containing protein [Vulcanimicrobiota bacterium]
MKTKANLLIFIAFFLGGLAWGFLPLDCLWRPTPVTQQDPTQTKEQINTELGTFALLAHELKPSVVNISVVRNLPGRAIFPDGMPYDVSGQGSGVIISSDGDVLTNNHVVDGAKTITIKLSDGRELDADIVGTDPKTDLALLKVRNASGLPQARLGDSDALAVGDWVMAIGNPFGLEATVTVGVLSGKGRVIGTGPYDDFLQTDASINPGNSGGPLFNTKGEVVGINTAIVPGGQGIGFSIPINLAEEVSAQLKKDGRVVRGFIGAGIQALTPALKSALGLKQETSGALVSSVVPGSPGQAAGLQVSDVLVAVNNNRITSDRDLLREVARLPIGEEVPFTLLRQGMEQTVFIKVAERPDDATAYRVWPEDGEHGARVGVAVTDVLDPRNQPVVMVTEVIPGTPAQLAGLKRGDLIRAVGATPISTSHDFVREVSRAKGDLALLVERQGVTSFVVIRD